MWLVASRALDGGEWISSVDLENLLMAHASVAEAAVIAIPTLGPAPPRGRRFAAGRTRRSENAASSSPQVFAKWQLPVRFEFVQKTPWTATGNFKKPNCASGSSSPRSEHVYQTASSTDEQHHRNQADHHQEHRRQRCRGSRSPRTPTRSGGVQQPVAMPTSAWLP